MTDQTATATQEKWPPPELLMQISNDPRLESFTGSFAHLRDLITDYLRRAGAPLETRTRILDFGCGPGRFLYAMRSLMRPGQELHGCDVNEACASWGSENIGFAKVIQNALEPPLPYPDEHFDFIYGLSVFTHLSLDLQFKWAWELHRVLKPGGVALLTTSSAPHLLKALVLGDLFAERHAYAFGADDLMCVFATAAGDKFEGQREVATTHSLGAAREVFSPFEIIEQEAIAPMAGGQTVNLLRRRQNRLIASVRPTYEGVFKKDLGASEPIWIELPDGANGALTFSVEFEQPLHIGRLLKWKLAMSGEDGATTAAWPYNTAFGADHFTTFTLPFKARSGPVSLKLTLEGLANVLPEDARFVLRFIRSEPNAR